MNRLATLRYLALPFHTAPLLLVAIFSVLLRLALQAGPLGLPALVILGSWFFKYAFLLLDHVAHGRPGTPVLTAEAANPLGEMRPLLYGLSVGAFYLATASLGGFTSPGVVSALRLLGLLALPAVLATHTITGSFAEALHPATVVGVARRMGSGYLVVLCVTVACGWAGRAVVLDAGQLAFVLRIALVMLLWLAMFSVLGGVIHDRRLELAYEPEHSPERRERRDQRDRDRERDRFLDQVFAEYRAGGRGNPWATIQARASQSASPLAEYAWIYDRVASWDKPGLADRVAQELLPLLLAGNRSGEALRIVRARLQANEKFRPLARALLRDFDQHYPGDASLVRAQRLAAELAR